MTIADRLHVIGFLKDFKICMADYKFIILRRCLPGIIGLGLTEYQAKQEILSLRCEHYGWGPTPDRNKDGTDVWIFGKIINGKFAYIKLKIHPERGAICMSFKETDQPFILPYK